MTLQKIDFVYRMKDIFYICSLLFALAACLL